MDAAAIAACQKRTALLHTLRQVFRSHRSRPAGEVIARINPILRGRVQYFAFGHSSRCFSYIRDWLEKKMRHHLARASQRHGFGWKRWSSAWLYGVLGLFNEYRVALKGVENSYACPWTKWQRDSPARGCVE